MQRLQLMMILVLSLGTAELISAQVNNKSSLLNSKHDFRASSSAEVRSSAGKDACIFCHTPHNAAGETYLWNHRLSNRDFPSYSSSTLQSTVTAGQPQENPQPFPSCSECSHSLRGTVKSGGAGICYGEGYHSPSAS